MDKIKTVATTTGVIGGGIASALGGWDSSIIILMVIMGVDFITGLMVAKIFEKSTKTESGALKSIEGWRGLCRKGMTLAIVLLSYLLDLVAGTNFIHTATIIAYIVIESLSVIENAGQMGVPIPGPIKKGIDILKDDE